MEVGYFGADRAPRNVDDVNAISDEVEEYFPDDDSSRSEDEE